MPMLKHDDVSRSLMLTIPIVSYYTEDSMATNRSRLNVGMARDGVLIYTTTKPSLNKVETFRIRMGSYQPLYEQIDDCVTPGFRHRRRSGVLPLNDVSLLKIRRAPCLVNLMNGPYPNWYAGGFEMISGDIAASLYGSEQDFRTYVEMFTEDVKMATLTKAYAKVEDPTILSGEILSDIGKTVSMFRSPFKATRTLLGKISSRKAQLLLKHRSLSSAKAASQAWLEYTYGWKPIILDTQKVIKEVTAKTPQSSSVARVVRSGKNLERTVQDPFVRDINGMTVEGTREIKTSLKVSAGVTYNVRNSFGQCLDKGKLLGSRAQDLPATIWEVIPYSFVVDWFVNIGDFIAATTPKIGIDFTGSWVTAVRSDECTYKGTITRSWQGVVNKDFIPVGKQTALLYERQVNLTTADLRPVVNHQLSVPHTISGMALMCTNLIGDLKGLKH